MWTLLWWWAGAASPVAVPGVFLPVGSGEPGAVVQDHPEGRLHPTARVRWYPMWTGADPRRSERLSVTPPVTVEAGVWRVLVEQWHHLTVGRPLAVVRVRVDGLLVAEMTTRARPFPSPGAGGMQADVVSFEVAAGGAVSIEVDEAARGGLWVGTIGLVPGGARPFYAIQHCANDVDRVERALARGANAVELDVMRTGGGLRIEHPVGSPPACWGGVTRADGVGPYLQHLGELARREELALVLLDLKGAGVDTGAYVGELVAAIRAAELEEALVVLSVPDCHAGAVRAASDAVGFAGHLDVWRDVAVAECPGRGEAERGVGAQFIGLGADPAYITRPMPQWLEPLRSLVHRRDTEGAPAKVYYWTVDLQTSMRVALDLGVDGLIVNAPGRLDAELGERPYRWLFRPATPADTRAIGASR